MKRTKKLKDIELKDIEIELEDDIIELEDDIDDLDLELEDDIDDLEIELDEDDIKDLEIKLDNYIDSHHNIDNDLNAAREYFIREFNKIIGGNRG